MELQQAYQVLMRAITDLDATPPNAEAWQGKKWATLIADLEIGLGFCGTKVHEIASRQGAEEQVAREGMFFQRFPWARRIPKPEF